MHGRLLAGRVSVGLPHQPVVLLIDPDDGAVALHRGDDGRRDAIVQRVLLQRRQVRPHQPRAVERGDRRGDREPLDQRREARAAADSR